MSHPVGGTGRDRLFVGLIEADVESGFALVDDAKGYTASGQAKLSLRAMQDTATVLADIERRLLELSESASAPFQPLVAELRNEIVNIERQTLEDKS